MHHPAVSAKSLKAAGTDRYEVFRKEPILREKLKDYALVCCLFVFLLIVLGGGLRLNPGGAFLCAATGTPVIVCGFTRLCGRPHKADGRINK